MVKREMSLLRMKTALGFWRMDRIGEVSVNCDSSSDGEVHSFSLGFSRWISGACLGVPSQRALKSILNPPTKSKVIPAFLGR